MNRDNSVIQNTKNSIPYATMGELYTESKCKSKTHPERISIVFGLLVTYLWATRDHMRMVQEDPVGVITIPQM